MKKLSIFLAGILAFSGIAVAIPRAFACTPVTSVYPGALDTFTTGDCIPSIWANTLESTVGTTTASSSLQQQIYSLEGSAWIQSGTVIYYTAGNVGVGDTNPLSQLEVMANSTNTTTTAGDASEVYITNSNTSTVGTTEGLRLRMFDASGTEVTGYAIVAANTSHMPGAASADLHFIGRNAGTLQDNLDVSSTGNITQNFGTANFNTTTISGSLGVGSAATYAGYPLSITGINAAAGTQTFIENTASTSYSEYNLYSDLTGSPASSTYAGLGLDNSNVSSTVIGYATGAENPLDLFLENGALNNGIDIETMNTSTASDTIRFFIGGNATSNLGLSIASGTVSTPYSVGINTTTPVGPLEVFDASGNSYIAFGTSDSSTFYGYRAGNIATSSGVQNAMFGGNAGTALTTGQQNTGFGYGSDAAVTSGGSNTGLGYAAVNKVTTASNDTGVGAGALTADTGANNSCVGFGCLNGDTTGAGNTAVGLDSLFGLTTGVTDIGIGSSAGRFINNTTSTFTTGSNDIFIGDTPYALTTSDNNEIVIGSSTVGLGSNTTVLGDSGTLYTAIPGNLYVGASATSTSGIYVDGSVAVPFVSTAIIPAVNIGIENDNSGSFPGRSGSVTFSAGANNVTSTYAQITGVNTNGTAGVGRIGDIVFSTKTTSTATTTQAVMDINSNGGVGIGTTTPSQTLTVVGSVGISGVSALQVVVPTGILTAGTCDSATTSINSVFTSSTAAIALMPQVDAGAGYYYKAAITAPQVLTTYVCAAVAGTAPTTTINIKLFE